MKLRLKCNDTYRLDDHTIFDFAPKNGYKDSIYIHISETENAKKDEQKKRIQKTRK